MLRLFPLPLTFLIRFKYFFRCRPAIILRLESFRIDIRMPSNISACANSVGVSRRANGTFIYYGHLCELRSRAP